MMLSVQVGTLIGDTFSTELVKGFQASQEDLTVTLMEPRNLGIKSPKFPFNNGNASHTQLLGCSSTLVSL